MRPRKKFSTEIKEAVSKGTVSSQKTVVDPIDEFTRAVSITADCADGTAIIADLLKNLHKDCYNEDEAELQFLYSKPSCFLILGKPGVGKTSLARRFAAEWKCIIINSTDIILENIELQTEIGLKCVEILTRGEAVSDEMVLKMIEDKVNSPEVAHHGYVMDDFPCLSEELLSIQDQLELIKNWKLKPDLVVSLRIPEKDIERRRQDQKVDPFTGVIYTKEVYAPDKLIFPPVADKPENEDEVIEEDPELEDEKKFFEDDMNALEQLSVEIVKRLVVRPEDMPKQVEQNLAKYRSNMLRALEDYMGDHDQQYLVELDGNMSVISLFKQLMQKLQTFVLRPAAVVTRLTDLDDDDLTEDMDTDDLMRALNSKQMVAPRYRWRRSKWLRNCPVALYEGNIQPGKPEFAVSFLDKMYCLSSGEALEKFMRNPRPYLVPKQPHTPCKFSVVGRPFSGKTTLCNLLAHHYKAKVFDIHSLARRHKTEEKMKHIEQVRIDATEKAIIQVKNRIRANLEADRQRKLRERHARRAAEAEALRLEQEKEDGESSESASKTNKDSLEETPNVGESSNQIDVIEEEKNMSNSRKKDAEEKKSDLELNEENEDNEGQNVAVDSQEDGAENLKDETLKVMKGTSGTAAYAQRYNIQELSRTASYAKDDLDLEEIQEPEVDAYHPEVTALVDIAVSMAIVAPIKITPEYLAELLETAILEWEKELRNTRHDGPLHGCWILDNFPETPEQWNACVERNLIPDAVYVLGEEVGTVDLDRIRSLCEAYCLKNKEIIYVEMSRRNAEKELKVQEARFEAQQKQILEEDKMRKFMDEERERQRILDEEAKVAQAIRQQELDQIYVNQVLWDTLAGELQTRSYFHEMGLLQPRGPSFISTLNAEFHDYSELYAALKDIEERKKRVLASEKLEQSAQKKEKKDHDATTAETIPVDEDSSMGTPVQVSSTVLDEDDKKEEDADFLSDNDLESIQEQAELEILMSQPEAKLFTEKLLHFERSMGSLLAAIAGSSSVVPLRIPYEGYSIEEVFATVIKNEAKGYKYIAWETEQIDLDEMEEDLEAETLEAAEGHENAEDKEEVEEEEEDTSHGIKKFLGEANYFDPVSLKEMNMLYPGNSEVAAMYREKMYYFSSNDTRERFIEEPSDYIFEERPLKPPPPRLLLLGPRGAGKTLHCFYLTEKLGIFHISFRDRLQELIIAKTKKKVGPDYDEEADESVLDESDSQGETGPGKYDNHRGEKISTRQSMSNAFNTTEDDDDEDSDEVYGDGSLEDDESRSPGSDENEQITGSKTSFMINESDARSIREETSGSQDFSKHSEIVIPGSRYTSKQGLAEAIVEEEEELELTEEEEAIKANLESNEPLPVEVLESILKPYWTVEPYKSTGFILEGFPRTVEEARFLQEVGLFPDAALLLQVSENDITGRLLPPKLDIWKAKRAKRLARRARNKEKSQEKRNSAIAKRKEILLKERDERRSAKQKMIKEIDEDKESEDDIGEEEADEEEEEDIDAILAEEFEEEEEAEEEEEEELEEDAVERMKNDISDLFGDENDRLLGVMDTLEEVLIPCLEIPAGRKPHIVRYIINKKMKPYVEYRSSTFQHVHPISDQLAKRMLQIGYKQPSRFGRWDPVLLKEGNCIQPMNGPDHLSFACLYRSYIYYLSSLQNRHSFIQDPVTYMNQESPKPVVPIRISIIGPPKSGKTTLANRFVEDYGVVRLSIGQALRYVLAQHPKSELTQQIQWNLIRGRVVPDELQIQALDVALLDVRCQTRGYVLDGYPMTLKQVELMTEHSIIPVKVIELELSSKEVLVRGVKDRLSSARTMALHDSTQVLAIKLSCYQRTVPEVRNWYNTQHMNHTIVPADQSKWWVLDAFNAIATSSIKRIQDYISRTSEGRSAGIAALCITPSEFHDRIGDYGEYCPVSLVERQELVDCSANKTLQYAAEFRGRYYKMAGLEELEMFLENPEKYVPPLAPYKLPPPEELPRRMLIDELEDKSPEILGYCAVTYLDGNLRYEALVPGNTTFAVEYKGKMYVFENEEKLNKFMKQPEKYADLTLPHKLPPAPEDMPLQNLPMLGFMEQTCAIAMVKALTAAGNVKPKYPFISSTRSALIYIAYHLKAFNPKSSPYIRKKYKQKLQQFQETCELIKYLGNNMTVRYRDPNERPKDFDNKLETFFALRGVEPTPTWLK